MSRVKIGRFLESRENIQRWKDVQYFHDVERQIQIKGTDTLIIQLFGHIELLAY